MESVPHCEDHPTKPLIFMCMACDELVCSRCKKADHEGHKTRDVDKAAHDYKKQIASKLKKVKVAISSTTNELQEARSSYDAFGESLESTKEAIEDRAGMVKRLLEEYVAETLQSAHDLAEEHGRAELCARITNLEMQATILQESKQQIQQAMKAKNTHYDIIGRRSLLSTLSAAPVSHTSLSQAYVFLPAKPSGQWREELKRFVGLPKVAYTSSESSDMVLSIRMTVPHKVQALQVLSDGRVCVVFSDRAIALPANAADAGTLVLGIYNQDGTLLQQHRLDSAFQQPRLSSTSNREVVVFCTLTGTKKTVDIGLITTEQNSELKDFLCCFRPESPKKFTLRSLSTSKAETHKIFEVGSDSSTGLFSVLTENPQTVVAHKSGQYFAVIQYCTAIPEAEDAKLAAKSASTPSLSIFGGSKKVSGAKLHTPQASVAVFKRPQEPTSKPQEALTTFRPREEHGFHPTDVCFFCRIDRDVLLVASAAGVYSVDYEAGGDYSVFMSLNSHLLQKPGSFITSLAQDHDGWLWIGCNNGNVLSRLHVEQVSNHYLLPKMRDAVGLDDSCDSNSSFESDVADDDVESSGQSTSAATTTSTDTTSTSESDAFGTAVPMYHGNVIASRAATTTRSSSFLSGSRRSFSSENDFEKEIRPKSADGSFQSELAAKVREREMRKVTAEEIGKGSQAQKGFQSPSMTQVGDNAFDMTSPPANPFRRPVEQATISTTPLPPISSSRPAEATALSTTSPSSMYSPQSGGDATRSRSARSVFSSRPPPPKRPPPRPPLSPSHNSPHRRHHRPSLSPEVVSESDGTVPAARPMTGSLAGRAVWEQSGNTKAGARYETIDLYQEGGNQLLTAARQALRKVSIPTKTEEPQSTVTHTPKT
ncbi:uncharacterized protein [Littorina saxatilis]|uniref:uncharacterized protein n=1 Tax=Littorina saxatilis TaxID=31220 RepID=UPI0038B41A73